LKKVVVIHTGGTISMHVNYESGAVISGDTNPLTSETDKLMAYADIHEIEAFNYPSPHITPTEMLALKNIIVKQLAVKEVDGFVITHGTDTLEETAYFLDLTIKSNVPIILTGAMRSSNEIGADGVYNLLSAVRVANSPNAIGKGVLVVMNDEIHTAQNVTKTSTSNVSTFQSPQYGPIGLITKTAIHFHHSPIRHVTYDVKDINKRVALLKVYAGMDVDLLTHVANKEYNGVVLEGLGQGNVPPALVPGIQQLINKHIPVVLVSRCYNGIAQPVYGYEGGGKMLKDMGVLFAHGLSGQKARLKLLIGLSDSHMTHTPSSIFEY